MSALPGCYILSRPGPAEPYSTNMVVSHCSFTGDICNYVIKNLMLIYSLRCLAVFSQFLFIVLFVDLCAALTIATLLRYIGCPRIIRTCIFPQLSVLR